ncbi:MAG: hypothetical protein HF962_06720 [Sulfurovum sp.]|nr:hypothetical protein [Sulfurovum sp.]
MKKMIKLGLISAVTAAMIVGCGGSGDGGSGDGKSKLAYLAAMGVAFEGDIHNLTDNWKTDGIMTWTKADKAKAFAAGCGTFIGVEVGTGKIADPIGGDDALGTHDVTKVESQFSWNSTADFYNNIHSIKKIWDAGLSELSTIAGVPAAKITEVDNAIEDALMELAEVSDFVGSEAAVLAGTYAIPEDQAFRNRMQIAEGNTEIIEARDAVVALTALLVDDIEATIDTGAAALNAHADTATHLAAIVAAIDGTYATLKSEATNLKTALITLKTSPTVANVTAARDAWRLARAPWEESEAHIGDPAPNIGGQVDGNVDSWPVPSIEDINNNLANWDGELATVIATDGEVKGFHAIEYFLFGDGSAIETPAETVTKLKQ